MQGSNLKGAIAEAEVAAAATKLGLPVLRPLTEHGRYDLVFEVGEQLLRVQCKWGALDSGAGVIKVNLATCRHTPRGYVYGSYTSTEIDLVAVYCGGLDRCYLLESALVAGMRGIYLRLSPPRNGQRACINLASKFEFAGAVAQWEERRRGTPEAGGSSPPSSTSSAGAGPATVVGANQFRNRFGCYMERAAAGETIAVTRHGKPYVQLSSAAAGARLFDSPPVEDAAAA
jgi:prevent-host-death family protein